MTGRAKKKAKKKKFASGVSQHNLLTFGQVKGLPSDDSDDSDYEPEQPSTSTMKRKRGISMCCMNNLVNSAHIILTQYLYCLCKVQNHQVLSLVQRSQRKVK